MDVKAPTVSNVRVTRPRFAVVARTARRAKRGTRFRYRLSEAATVRIILRRRSHGRKVAGKCRSRTRANRRHATCIRYRWVARLRQAGVAGRNTKWFGGWVGARRFHPGIYRARFVATDAAGNRSRPKAVRFTIVRRRHGAGPR